MKYFGFKNTSSSTGADFAPSSRSAVNTSADTLFSDTAVAVSVLFSLLIAKSVLMGLIMLVSLVAVLILMCIGNDAKKTATMTDIAV